MKKVFKASLIASAMALSLGAQAATVSSTPAKLSAEGVAQGVKAENQNLSFDVVVDKLHPAASVITITFDKNVDLSDLTVEGAVAVTNTPASGTGTTTNGEIAFDYGTGSFTFDNVVVDTTTNPNADTLSFTVNLGNPLIANSAFRVKLNGVVDYAGASSITYSSKTSGGEPIETGAGVIAETKDQFAFSVTNEFDALINRTDRTEFTDGAADDVLTVKLVNDTTLLAALTGATGVVTLDGDFTDLLAADFGTSVNAITTPGFAVTADDAVTFDLVAADMAAPAGKSFNVDFSRVTAVDIPQTGDIAATLRVTPANASTTAFNLPTVSAGEWQLDAAIVNVPYLPIGFGLYPAVEVSNHGNTDAALEIEGFDDKGNTYGPVSLADLAAHQVTKISEATIAQAFGLTGKVKLNVTFVMDADADKITLAPYYKEGSSRINVITDQYKGQDIR